MAGRGAVRDRPANHNSRLRPPAQQRRTGGLQAGGTARGPAPVTAAGVRPARGAHRRPVLCRDLHPSLQELRSRRPLLGCPGDPLHSAEVSGLTRPPPCHGQVSESHHTPRVTRRSARGGTCSFERRALPVPQSGSDDPLAEPPPSRRRAAAASAATRLAANASRSPHDTHGGTAAPGACSPPANARRQCEARRSAERRAAGSIPAGCRLFIVTRARERSAAASELQVG